ncbi:MAG: FHA domain-containing protein [Thermoguttaceae bacterium]|jgi:pSer/pThr/pTyr-binding forkhead associated (FHA) protein
MDVKLIVVGGKNAGQKIPVAGPKFLIGRAEDCQLRPRSDLVSRHHCVLLLEQGSVAVRDLGSKNGTLVNDEEIKSQRELKAGDHLKVGALEFEVALSVELSGKKKPKVRNVQEAARRTIESAGGKDQIDLDVTQWLADDDDETPTPGHLHDTSAQTVNRPAQKSAPAAEPTKKTAPAVGPAAATSAGAPAETASERRTDPMDRDEAPPPTAASSRAAANDMLKQFFHRKP